MKYVLMMAALAAVTLLMAMDCNGGSSIAVNAGSNQSVGFGDTVALSGTAVGTTGTVIYSWSFQSKPPDSALTDSSITGANTLNASFTPDAPGTYILTLTVIDDFDQGDALVAITVTGSALTVDAGTDQNATVGITVELSGSVTETLTSPAYSWTIDSKPTGSAITDSDITDRTSLEASFEPDVEGTYVLELSVTDGDAIGSDLVSIAVASADQEAAKS